MYEWHVVGTDVKSGEHREVAVLAIDQEEAAIVADSVGVRASSVNACTPKYSGLHVAGLLARGLAILCGIAAFLCAVAAGVSLWRHSGNSPAFGMAALGTFVSGVLCYAVGSVCWYFAPLSYMCL